MHYFHVSAVDVKTCICKFYSSSRREIIKFAFLIKGRLRLVSSKAVVLPRLAVYAVRTFNDPLMTLSAVFTADHFSIKSRSKYVKLNSLACERHLCLKYSYAWYCKSDLVIAQHEEHAAYRGLRFL